MGENDLGWGLEGAERRTDEARGTRSPMHPSGNSTHSSTYCSRVYRNLGSRLAMHGCERKDAALIAAREVDW